MRWLLVGAALLSGGLAAGTALADDITGTVEKVDAASNSVWIGGVSYQIEAHSAPLKFADIKVGDKVRVTFDHSGDGNIASAVAPAK